MKRVADWIFDTKNHPLRLAIFRLVAGLVNGHEAVYVRPNSLMSIVDGAFALLGFFGFLALLFQSFF